MKNTTFAQACKFAAVGVFNTLVGLSIIWGAMKLGAPPLAANVMGYAVGLAVSFLLNRQWTFQQSGAKGAGGRFIATFAVSYLLNLIILSLSLKVLKLDPYLAQLPAAVGYSACFFVLSKYFVFVPNGTPQGPVTALPRLLPAVLLLIAAASVVKAITDRSDTVDFKYIWLAGHLWNAGIDAYSPAYVSMGGEIFAGLNRPTWWVYPPNWWGVAAASSLLPYTISVHVWRVLCVAFMLIGCAILYAAVQQSEMRASRLRASFFVFFTCASSTTAIAINLGQTSTLVFLGVCLFAAAWLRQSSRLMTLAITLLMLKPNLGIVFAAMLVAFPFFWRSLVLAAGATAILALPPLLAHDPMTVIRSYVALLGQYDTDSVNAPVNTTGLRNLVHFATGAELPAIRLAIAGAVLALMAGVLLRRATTDADRAALASLIICITLFFVPMHTYDLLIAAPLILLCSAAAGWVQWFVVAGTAALFRPNNLWQLTSLEIAGETYFVGSLFASLAILVLLIAATASMLKPPRSFARHAVAP